MLDLILKVLKNNNIDEYIINETKKEAYELYMIKKAVDMDRRKNITIYTVTVFKDNGNDLKGSSVVKVYPSMEHQFQLLINQVEHIIYIIQLPVNLNIILQEHLLVRLLSHY